VKYLHQIKRNPMLNYLLKKTWLPSIGEDGFNFLPRNFITDNKAYINMIPRDRICIKKIMMM
jgi:hypothetical protein